MKPEVRAAFQARIDRLHKRAARDKALMAAGQAALDWAKGTGSCHFCGYDELARRPHGDECPLKGVES